MGGLSVLTLLAVVGCIAILPRLLYIFQVARRRKVETRFRFRRAAIGVVLYGLSCAVLRHFGYTIWETLAFSVLLGLMSLVFVKAPRRSRKIPAWVKREVIARDLRGQPFDSRIHHLHHVWPFILGGDNSVENLRVVTKRYNLSHGAKRPRLRDLLGYSPKLNLESGSPSEEAVSGLVPERTPRRLRFVGRILLVAAILGFFWLARNQKTRANSEAALRASTTSAAPVTPTAGAEPIQAAGQPEASTATPAPLPLSPSPADAGTGAGEGEAPQGTLPNSPQDSASTVGTGPPPETPSAQPAAPLQPAERTYTTSELLAMYKAGKHWADTALKGNRIQVVGTLEKIGKDEVSLRESGDRDLVNCKFDAKEALIHGRLSLGTVVTVRGNVKGRGLTGNVHLGSCELVSIGTIATTTP